MLPRYMKKLPAEGPNHCCRDIEEFAEIKKMRPTGGPDRFYQDICTYVEEDAYLGDRSDHCYRDIEEDAYLRDRPDQKKRPTWGPTRTRVPGCRRRGLPEGPTRPLLPGYRRRGLPEGPTRPEEEAYLGDRPDHWYRDIEEEAYWGPTIVTRVWEKAPVGTGLSLQRSRGFTYRGSEHTVPIRQEEPLAG